MKKLLPVSKEIILHSLKEAQTVLDRFINNPQHISAIEKASEMMVQSILGGRKIIACGNGGSMGDAMHFAEELSGRFREERRALPAVSISDPSHITCVGNDYGFDHVFSRYIEALGNEGDVLLAISTSGNSANVLNAVHAAHHKGMKVISLTGKTGGTLRTASDVNVNVDHLLYSDRIQEIHIKVIHIIIELIENKLNE